jgi:hypothetical protein
MEWGELDELLFADSWNEELGLHRSTYAFRGRSRADDDLSNIPEELKWEVRDKLDQANIPERVPFPGLDGLTRYYAPRR